MNYAELAVTTNFSFLRGGSHPEELVTMAKALGLAALGIADRNSLAGVVRAHVAAKEVGQRLLVGARLAFEEEGMEVLCYPVDRAAYGRLSALLTLGKRRAEKGACRLLIEDLHAAAEGQMLIVLPPPAGLPDPAFEARTAALIRDFPGEASVPVFNRGVRLVGGPWRGLNLNGELRHCRVSGLQAGSFCFHRVMYNLH